MFRFFLYVIIAWFVFRILRSLLNPGSGAGPRQQRGTTGKSASQARRKDDFSRENIQDAEFEDLTPPPDKQAHPPKTP